MPAKKNRPELRETIQTLRAQGTPLRRISRLLKLSRNTVRRILRTDPPAETEAPNAACCAPETLTRIEDAFGRAGGNVVRVAELLSEEHELKVPYSTLTRWVREAGLREAPRRAGTYTFAPGEESQHDTSPHRVEIGGRTVTAHCASLVLAFSRRLFIQYYPRFTRFEAKAFLDAAFTFMDGTCPRCVIDNSSVIVVAGTGPDATIAPDMRAFGEAYGVSFRAHRLGHADRKARVERPFAYVERNFLAARHFEDFDDLNAQALRWCREIANAKLKRALGMAPEAAYVLEKPHLLPLPQCRPPIYETHERIVDVSGYVCLDTNRYSVPERCLGKRVTVYKYPAEVRIYRRDHPLATHPRLIGQRDAYHTLPGHHPRPEQPRPHRAPSPEEHRLRGEDERLDRYVAALKQHAPGRGLRRLRRLLELKRTYPRSAFLAAIDTALKYGLYDLARLEQLILRQVAGDFFALGRDEDDD
jgi:transposase